MVEAKCSSALIGRMLTGEPQVDLCQTSSCCTQPHLEVNSICIDDTLSVTCFTASLVLQITRDRLCLETATASVIMSSGDPSRAYWITTEDGHTAGEPFRIVEHLPAGHLPIGATVAKRRAVVLDTHSHPLDLSRRTLCHEPCGHGDMYGGFITSSDDVGAHFLVLF
jgi:hypothetical protein